MQGTWGAAADSFYMGIAWNLDAAARAGLTDLDMTRLSAASEGRKLPPPTPHVQRQILQIRVAKARRAASSAQASPLAAIAVQSAIRRCAALHAEMYPAKKRPA